MVRLACLVLVNVQVGVSPAATVTLTLSSPGSSPAVALSLHGALPILPMRTVAPPLVQLMPVRSQPVRADSVTYLVPSWDGLKTRVKARHPSIAYAVWD